MTGIMAAMAGAMGGPVSVILTPGDVDDSGSSSTRTFSEGIVVTGGIATSFTWSFTPSSGSWGAIGGQGTANANITATATLGNTASGTLSCSVVVNGTTYVRSCSLSYTHENPI